MIKYLLLAVVIVGLYFNKDSVARLVDVLSGLATNKVKLVPPILPKETKVEDGYILITKRQVLHLEDGVHAIPEGELAKVISISPENVYTVSYKGLMFAVEGKYTSSFN